MRPLTSQKLLKGLLYLVESEVYVIASSLVWGSVIRNLLLKKVSWRNCVCQL